MTQHRIVWDQTSSPWNTMSVTNAAVVRLMACSGNEREISPSWSQLYVFPVWQIQTWISSRRAIRICASFDKTLGRRCQRLWLSIQELVTVMPMYWLTSHLLTDSDGSWAIDTANGSEVFNEGQRKLDVCTVDGQQRRSMIFMVAGMKIGSGIENSQSTSFILILYLFGQGRLADKHWKFGRMAETFCCRFCFAIHNAEADLDEEGPGDEWKALYGWEIRRIRRKYTRGNSVTRSNQRMRATQRSKEDQYYGSPELLQFLGQRCHLWGSSVLTILWCLEEMCSVEETRNVQVPDLSW